MKGNICIPGQQSSSENNTDHLHNILTSHIAPLNNNVFSPLSKNVSILEYINETIVFSNCDIDVCKHIYIVG